MARTTRTCNPRAAALAALPLVLAACAGPGGTAADPPAPAAAASPAEAEAPATGAGGYLAARQAYKGDDLDTAAAHYRVALGEDPDNPALVRRAFLARLEIGDAAGAAALAERGLATGAVAPFMHLSLGVERARLGDWDGAADFFLLLPRSRLGLVMRPMLAGWAAAGRGDAAGADRAFAGLAAMPGFETLALLHIAHAAALGGDGEAAGAAFRDALARNPDPPPRLRLAAAAWLASERRMEEARRALGPRSRRGPDPAAAAAMLDRAAAGEPVPELVSSAAEGAAEALFDLASAMQRERSRSAAMALARLALRLRPDFPLAQLLVGEILDDRGRHAEAAAIYRDVPLASPYGALARLRAAASLRDLGRTGEAAAALAELAGERPRDPVPWIRLGDLRRGDKDWGEAIAAYDRAEARIDAPGPEDWRLFYTRGIALERAKDWKRAERDFLKALELSPDQPYVMNYLGYSWTEQGVHLERAERLIEKAVELRPNDGYILDSLGWVLFRTGRFHEAVPKLERAVRLKPNDPTINDHLGDAYWRVGRRIEAGFQWRRALAMDPEAELLSAIEEKLERGLPAPDRPDGSGKTAGGAHVPGA